MNRSEYLYQECLTPTVCGAQFRFLPGDYQGITSADALRLLLRLSEEHAAFRPFFYETSGDKSFHPKSYIFVRGLRGVAWAWAADPRRGAGPAGVQQESMEGDVFQ